MPLHRVILVSVESWILKPRSRRTSFDGTVQPRELFQIIQIQTTSSTRFMERPRGPRSPTYGLEWDSPFSPRLSLSFLPSCGWPFLGCRRLFECNVGGLYFGSEFPSITPRDDSGVGWKISTWIAAKMRGPCGKAPECPLSLQVTLILEGVIVPGCNVPPLDSFPHHLD